MFLKSFASVYVNKIMKFEIIHKYIHTLISVLYRSIFSSSYSVSSSGKINLYNLNLGLVYPVSLTDPLMLYSLKSHALCI